jgi:hypothetical protein
MYQITKALRSPVIRLLTAQPSAGFAKLPMSFYNHEFESDFKVHAPAAKIKCFQVIDEDGKVINKKYENIDKDLLLRMFKLMITVNEVDTVFNQAQRSGRISFYMTGMGEEASIVGKIKLFINRKRSCNVS